jgi:unsaturated rhamnogalacturonyl hydrolase
LNFQDETGLWYQVTDMGDKEGNYLEASGSAMFSYAFAKGHVKGYLPEKFKTIAHKTFDGLLSELVEVDADGEVHINQICKSAGLGGDPYRDGSFEYYISEPIVTDNLHGTGPFILAALALNQ